MKEVKLKRYVDPYECIPNDNFIRSPVGLIEKDQGNETRLIFHLSHPRGTSLNDYTPKEKCSLQKYR